MHKVQFPFTAFGKQQSPPSKPNTLVFVTSSHTPLPANTANMESVVVSVSLAVIVTKVTMIEIINPVMMKEVTEIFELDFQLIKVNTK